jgi:hypothetical protein
MVATAKFSLDLKLALAIYKIRDNVGWWNYTTAVKIQLVKHHAENNDFKRMWKVYQTLEDPAINKIFEEADKT